MPIFFKVSDLSNKMVDFLKEFLTNPKATGSIHPSSSHLAEAMTNAEMLGSSRCVIELGPGTGIITERILTKLPKDCIFFTVEINPAFAMKVKEKFPEVTVYSDSAENIQKYLQKHKREGCDTVISSLPWTFFDQQTQQQIFESVYHSLSPGGKMVTFVYPTIFLFPSGRRFRKLLQQHFPSIKKKIIWKNFPPAIVYECRR